MRLVVRLRAIAPQFGRVCVLLGAGLEAAVERVCLEPERKRVAHGDEEAFREQWFEFSLDNASTDAQIHLQSRSSGWLYTLAAGAEGDAAETYALGWRRRSGTYVI